jgi:hypothetical protein
MKMPKRNFEIAAVVGFILVHLFAPLAVGELYPFTVSPMFSDQPAEYCVYEVRDEQGKAMDLEPFGLHLVYDGNPVGLGMGIRAAPTMHEFGEVSTLDGLRKHVQQKLKSMPQIDSVTVIRRHVSCQDSKLIEAVIEIEVERPEVDEQN